MPTHSLYLTTNIPTINIPTPLIDAVEYLPLTTNFNNYGNNNTLILTSSDTTNVTFSSNIPSVTFNSNAYLISSNVTLQIPISFCYWIYTPMPVLNGPYVTPFSIGNGSFTAGSDCFETKSRNINNIFEQQPSIYTTTDKFTLSAYGGVVAANKWLHICFTITSTTLIFYVDGVAVKSYSPVPPKTYIFRTLTSYKYIFGRIADGSAYYFNGGSIRHFARFNYALSITQINDIRNATLI